MLVSLHVKNLAIIDEVEVDFSNHLNILTGETGAGKSIIIGSINIALGGKVSSDIIRKGADYALVELVFQVDQEVILNKVQELDLPIEEGQIILSRKIMKSRSISRVNGETVTVAVLKELSEYLIDIHGQHEHQSLLYKNKHLEILDQFAKNDVGDLKEQLAACYKAYKDIKNQIIREAIPEEERLREVSFLEYKKNEIELANLVSGEDKELEISYRKLSNANTIIEGVSSIYGITGDGSHAMSDELGRATRQLTKLEEYDEKLGEYSKQLLEIEDLLNDFNREISTYMSDLNYNTEEFQKVEERLNLIHSLKAKYGQTIEDIKEYYKTIIEKLEKYQDYEKYMQKLQGKLKKKEKELEVLAGKLSAIRKEKAQIISKKIKSALLDLNFLGVRFEVAVRELGECTELGKDEVEFVISTNPGEDVKPLGKVASGGELSRVMLAIKSVLAEQDAIDTLIFDEIDVGVSGRTAQKVSEKMSFISQKHQIICITHLPQIAAMADEHYIIEKHVKSEETKTVIRKLNQEGSIAELARILGGAKITETVMQSAQEMKELAETTKVF